MKTNKDEIFFEATKFDTIRDCLKSSALNHKDNIAYQIKEKNNGEVSYKYITYTQLIDDINALGTAIYDLKIKKSRVAVIGKNRYEWIVSHLSNVFGSNVSIPLDKDLQVDELENSLIRSKAEAIIFDTKLLPSIKEIQSRKNTKIKHFICMDKIDGYLSVPELIEKGYELLDDGQEEYLNTKINKEDMCVLLFTSGTTSKSKAVMLSNKNIATNIYALECVEDIRETDVNIAFLPFHHILGSTCMLFMLAKGAKTVFPDGLKYIKQNLVEYKVSVFVGVPVLTEAIYKAVIKEIEKQGKLGLIKAMTKITNFLNSIHIDVRRKVYKQILSALGGNLRLMITGGAPADPVSIKGFNDFGVTTLQGYGLSETSPVIAAENYKYKRVGSVGKPMVGVTVKIIDKDEDGIGEIITKSDCNMIGYYEMEDLTKEALKDGWFHTGDLGYIDKDGFLFVTGRSKNLIVLKNGKKVFPEELETVANRIDLVSESMVYGTPEKDNENDVTVSIKVVYDDEVIKEKYSDKSEEELDQLVWEKIKEINTTFPKYKHIKKLITSHEELIKTTTKKVKRNEEMKKIFSK